MSNPFAYISDMVASWPDRIRGRAELEQQAPVAPRMANRMAIEARDLVPEDQPIVYDWQARSLLERIAMQKIHAGTNAWIWLFSDGSALFAGPQGHKAFAKSELGAAYE